MNTDRMMIGGLAVLLVCACHAAQDFGGQVIRTTGKFPCFQNQVIIEVNHGSGEKLSYRVHGKKASFGPSNPSLRSNSQWLILAESPSSVWVYDGQGDVSLIELYPDGGAKFTSQQVVPELLEKAPKAFLSQLPAELEPT